MARARQVSPKLVYTRLEHRILNLTSDDFMAGIRWWSDAEDWLANLSIDTGHAIPNLAAGLAILSPTKSWDQNKNILAQLAESPQADPKHWMKCWSKAHLCLYSANPDLDVLVSGPKVHPFYLNLLGQDEPVTVDRHMIRLVYPTDTQTMHRISTITSAIQYFSRVKLNSCITPRELQASLWLKVRELV